MASSGTLYMQSSKGKSFRDTTAIGCIKWHGIFREYLIFYGMGFDCTTNSHKSIPECETPRIGLLLLTKIKSWNYCEATKIKSWNSGLHFGYIFMPSNLFISLFYTALMFLFELIDDAEIFLLLFLCTYIWFRAAVFLKSIFIHFITWRSDVLFGSKDLLSWYYLNYLKHWLKVVLGWLLNNDNHSHLTCV